MSRTLVGTFATKLNAAIQVHLIDKNLLCLSLRFPFSLFRPWFTCTIIQHPSAVVVNWWHTLEETTKSGLFICCNMRQFRDASWRRARVTNCVRYEMNGVNKFVRKSNAVRHHVTVQLWVAKCFLYFDGCC